MLAEGREPGWGFLTNYAQVLLCIARQPDLRLREIGDRVGITERATHRIVVELEAAGYLERAREGRRNRYTIAPDAPLRHGIARERSVADLLRVIATESHSAGPQDRSPS